MTHDSERARVILDTGTYTCVLCCGDTTHTSTRRGVAPLVAWYAEGTDLRGFSAADRVVGRGAAFLYILLGVTAVHAVVISAPALSLLTTYGITVTYDTCVDHIINRTGDGPCPFEHAVLDIEEPAEAYRAIRLCMAQMHIVL